KTRAVRDGDHYVVTGQKIWTTLGHYGDWIFCLVRTDAKTEKRQDGISFLLVDMTTPGITVRPIVLMDQGHEVNEVFFDEVRVPAENLVHEEGKGWTVAKYLLGYERMGSGNIAVSKRELARHQRDPAQHHRQGHARAVREGTPWTSSTATSRSSSPRRCASSSTRATASTRGPRSWRGRPGTARTCGRCWPRWASSPCRST